MHLERGQSIFNMLGGYEPSRAANESEGNDPVSLGMLPAAREVAVPSTPPHAAPRPPAPEPAQAPASGGQVAMPDEDVVLLGRGVAIMRGKIIPLSIDHTQYIVSVLMHALEISMANELMTMRQEYGLLQAPQLEQAVQPGDDGAGVVREVQGETQETYETQPNQHADPVLHEMPKAKDRKRSLRLVPDNSTGTPTTEP